MNTISQSNPESNKKAFSQKWRILIVALIGFLIFQTYLLEKTVNNVKSIVKESSSGSQKIYSIYNDLISASRGTDQEKIINHFNQLHQSKNAVGDLLLSQYVLSLKNSVKNGKPNIDDDFIRTHPKEAEEYRFKLTEETKNYIIKEFLKNPKDGINEIRNSFNYSCSILNIPCYLTKAEFVKISNERADNIENKLDISLYNINHIEEYQAWSEKFINNAGQNKELLPSPGQVEVEKKFK
jgi:hypothetical protein